MFFRAAPGLPHLRFPPGARVGFALLIASLAQGAPEAPRLLLQESGAAVGLLRLPNGSFAFYNRVHPEGGPLALADRDGGRHVLRPELPATLAASEVIRASKALANTQAILTPDGKIISVAIRGETLDPVTAKSVGLTRYLDVWLTCADPARAEEPRRIWRGYNGSQMEYQQLPSGRILVPFGSMQPHAKAAPPTGRHATVILLSDDGGRTWSESPSRLVAPCYEGFNGSNEGACEPCLEPLGDGRLWMLLRTQAGFLYQSHSADEGKTWAPATASRFHTSTGPANLLRHRNGWLVLTWNNCELPRRLAGVGVYGGRDALHMAVSDDDGRTWRGFREIYLDFRRNDNPEKSGDRGTAYPLAAYTDEGRMVVVAGQGAGGRHALLVDPAWIVATEAHTDFSDGLGSWSLYKHHGPARGWWRARAVGGRLVPDPANPAARSLHLRKADDLPADVGVWNFPNGWKGTLHARVQLRRGHHGAMFCLNDRFFDPSESLGTEFAVFRAACGPDGRLGRVTLEPERWYELTFAWDLSARTCRVLVDHQEAATLPLAHETLNGLSYVRFASAATELDPNGFLIGSVRVSLTDPRAPACTREAILAHEQRYVTQLVPRWRP